MMGRAQILVLLATVTQLPLCFSVRCRLNAALTVKDMVYFIQDGNYAAMNTDYVQEFNGTVDNNRFFNISYPVSAAFGDKDPKMQYVVSGTEYYTYFFKYRNGPTSARTWSASLATGIQAIARHDDFVYFFKGCYYYTQLPDGDFLPARDMRQRGLPCNADAAWDDGGDMYVSFGSNVYLWALGYAIGPACFSQIYDVPDIDLCACTATAKVFKKSDLFTSKGRKRVLLTRRIEELKRLYVDALGNPRIDRMLRAHLGTYQRQLDWLTNGKPVRQHVDYKKLLIAASMDIVHVREKLANANDPKEAEKWRRILSLHQKKIQRLRKKVCEAGNTKTGPLLPGEENVQVSIEDLNLYSAQDVLNFFHNMFAALDKLGSNTPLLLSNIAKALESYNLRMHSLITEQVKEPGLTIHLLNSNIPSLQYLLIHDIKDAHLHDQFLKTLNELQSKLREVSMWRRVEMDILNKNIEDIQAQLREGVNDTHRSLLEESLGKFQNELLGLTRTEPIVVPNAEQPETGNEGGEQQNETQPISTPEKRVDVDPRIALLTTTMTTLTTRIASPTVAETTKVNLRLNLQNYRSRMAVLTTINKQSYPYALGVLGDKINELIASYPTISNAKVLDLTKAEVSLYQTIKTRLISESS